MTIPRIIEGVRTKGLEVTLLFVDFDTVFDYILTEKIKQKLLEKTKKMLNKNTKCFVHLMMTFSLEPCEEIHCHYFYS